MLDEVVVGGGEVAATDKAAIGGEGRGVRGGEDKVVPAVDELSFALGIAAPEHIDDVLALLVECLNGGIGEFFPTMVLVAARAMGLYGEGGIEKEYALLGPMKQITGCRDRKLEVAMEFLIDILE